MSVLALCLIGFAVYVARKRTKGVLLWRRIKLASAVCGTVGLVLFFVNFEKTLRDTISVRARNFAYAEFIDLKLLVAERVSIACAHTQDGRQAALTCSDLKNIDEELVSQVVRDDTHPFAAVVNWQKNPDIDQFVKEVNARLAIINQAIPAGAEAHSFLSDEDRIGLMFLSAIFVIAALAGSIGEATFQLVRFRIEAEAAGRDRA